MNITTRNIEGVIIYNSDDTQVKVKALGVEKEDGTKRIVLTVFKGNVPCGSIETAMSDLTKNIDKLKDFGIAFVETSILDITRTTKSAYENLPIIPYSDGYGWQKTNGQPSSFIGVDHVSIEGKPLPYIITPDSLKANGDIDYLKEEIKTYLANPVRQAIVSASFASAICGYLDENLLVSIIGKSSTGKTTVADLAVSIYSAVMHGVTKQKFNATEYAMLKRIGNNKGIPLVIDDTSLSKVKDMTGFLYQLAEGRDRDRLGKNATLEKTSEWATTIFLTGEKTILFQGNNELQGKSARLIELTVSGNDLFDSGEEAQRISKIAREHYGLLGNAFVNDLIKERILESIGCLIEADTKDAVQGLTNLITEDVGVVNRLSRKIAIITATAELLNNIFSFGLDVVGIRDYLVNVCANNILTFKELNDEEAQFKKLYKDFFESIAEIGERKPDFPDAVFVSSSVFKRYSEEVFNSKKSKRYAKLIDRVEAMSEYNCLVTKGNPYRYITENGTQYGLKKPEVIFCE